MATDPLLPVRHPENDMFICDFGEVIPKSDIASMEHPLFTLATKPDLTIKKYEHNGNTVKITPSVLGMSTIHDKDVLIYCISQLMAASQLIDEADNPNHEVKLSKKLVFKAHDLLITTNRPTGGESYKRLDQAFSRLAGTLIETNIKTNGEMVTDKFHILDHVQIKYDDPESEKRRMVSVEVTLSEWLYNSVLGKEVLSINKDYFRIRKPIERRIYEIARKHCGRQPFWQITIEKLHKKVGAAGNIRQFRVAINHLVKNDHLPDYHITLDPAGSKVGFTPKEKTEIPALYTPANGKPEDDNLVFPKLKTSTLEKAKSILGHNFDVYAIEIEWQEWWRKSGAKKLNTADGAFIGFCKQKIGES